MYQPEYVAPSSKAAIAIGFIGAIASVGAIAFCGYAAALTRYFHHHHHYHHSLFHGSWGIF